MAAMLAEIRQRKNGSSTVRIQMNKIENAHITNVGFSNKKFVTFSNENILSPPFWNYTACQNARC